MTNAVLCRKLDAGYPLNRIVVIAASMVLFAISGFADDYIINVPDGEVYEMSSYRTALGSSNLIKEGGGTLVAGDEMADYTGDIYITNGVYRATTGYALGPTAGSTYISNAGTLHNMVSSGTFAPSFGTTERFYIGGNGYCGGGAVSNTVSCENFAKNVTFTDNTTLFSFNRWFQFREATVKVANYNITFKAPSRNGALGFFCSTEAYPQNLGNLDIYGLLAFGASSAGGSKTKTVSIHEGGAVQLSNSRVKQARTLIMDNGTAIQANRGTVAAGTVSDNNHWSGPVTLNGNVTNLLATGITFSGEIQGSGGFVPGETGGGWLQLSYTNNTFEGGVGATGSLGADGSIAGGIAVLAQGAVPADGGAVTLRDAMLATFGDYNTLYWTFPDLVVEGSGAVTGASERISTTFKSLVKTGDGTLTFNGPAKILGDADIQGGTVRFGTSVPDIAAGLKYWGKEQPGKSGQATTFTVPSDVPYKGTVSGPIKAYVRWVSVGPDKDANHKADHYYKGYIRIPGEEGVDQVTCNFVSALNRYSRLAIDGNIVIDQRDNKNWNTGDAITTDYNRFNISSQLVYTAGWHEFAYYAGNYNDKQGGPRNPTAAGFDGWSTAFLGLGVDWSGRCETNIANYVKLIDPGDGSLFRSSLTDGKSDLDASQYRPEFCGEVAFGSGTVLDIGDTEPYVALSIPSLTGVPTITNGAVSVGSSVWTLRPADIAGGVPLTVASNASLEFPEGPVTVDIEGVANLRSYGVSGRPHLILSVQDGADFPQNTFVVSQSASDERWQVYRVGNQLYLRRVGTVVIVF
ncbi:MAG: hypothetical protein IJI35_16715 [Kiritimatiellae bacterium]|nr:hypothetical protein [Kiritimatiellia bacterium]